LSDVIDLEVTHESACAVKSDRTIICWGNDHDTTGSLSGPVTQYDGTTDERKVKHIAMGDDITCVVSIDNKMKCFGRMSMEYQPENEIIAITMSSHSNHGCMILDQSGENVMCFGSNILGQLGDGTTINAYTTPVSPVNLGHAKYIAMSTHYQSCASLDDNSQKCWGQQDANWLIGTDPSIPGNKLVPTEVVTTSNINLEGSSIIGIHAESTAAYLHLSDNRVYIWGYYGHLLLGGREAYPYLLSGYGSAELVPLNTTIPPFPGVTETPSMIPSYSPFGIPSSPPTVSPQPSISQFSWELELDTPGYLKSPPNADDGVQEFITAYNISDRDYQIDVYKSDCSSLSHGLPLKTVIDNKSSGKNHIEAVFLYNQSLVQMSNLWEANATGGDANFCVKLGLYTNATNGILFNFIETKYQIQVDLTSGFSSAVDIVRTEAFDGGSETIDIDENITVYQCDDLFNELTSPSPLTQGDSLQICVETEEDSVFEVGAIKDVEITQNGTKNFMYVDSFVDSYWADASCVSVNTTSSKCKVQMQLLGDYFDDTNPEDLIVTGFVKMDYLGRRRLLGADSLDVTKFTLDVSLSESIKPVVEGTLDTVDDEENFVGNADKMPGSDASPTSKLYGIVISVLMIVLSIYDM